MSSFTDRLMGKLFSRPRSRKGQRPQSARAVMESNHGDTGNWPSELSGHASGGNQIHSEAIASVAAILPTMCLSGCKDGVVRLYDIDSQSILESWSAHSSAITKVCYGAACNSVFSASRDKTIKLWKRGNPQCDQEFTGHTLVVSAIHTNEDCSLLASGSRDNTVRLWDIQTGTCTKTNSIPQNLVTDVKFVPASSLLVQAGEDKEVRIFDIRTMEPAFSFPKKQYIQMSCDISQDGRFICSCSNGFSGNGCEVTIWDLRQRKLLLELWGHHEAVESCIFLFGSDKEQQPLLIASASRDCSAKLWDATSGVCLSTCSLSGSGPLTSLAGLPHNRLLVGSFNQGVHVLKTSPTDLLPLFAF